MGGPPVRNRGERCASGTGRKLPAHFGHVGVWVGGALVAVELPLHRRHVDDVLGLVRPVRDQRPRGPLQEKGDRQSHETPAVAFFLCRAGPGPSPFTLMWSLTFPKCLVVNCNVINKEFFLPPSGRVHQPPEPPTSECMHPQSPPPPQRFMTTAGLGQGLEAGDEDEGGEGVGREGSKNQREDGQLHPSTSIQGGPVHRCTPTYPPVAIPRSQSGKKMRQKKKQIKSRSFF